ncbi:MAG: alanine racemase [Thermoanaerobaculia bacterium]|nr:alanine racemase [Thermoanaerobaculia bacterium]
METSSLNTWVELSAAAYAANLRFFASASGRVSELAAVVKANAYGHGWREIAQLAVRAGADSFCVHSLEEALELRAAGFAHDVLIMGHVPLARLETAVTAGFRLVLYNRESLERLGEITEREGSTARVHLKLETGTYRQGVDERELGGFLAALTARRGVRLEGVYTHFANIEDTTSHEFAIEQRQRFERMAAVVEAGGFAPLLRHAACSAATLLFPETHLGMVRLGISQYGLWPSKETFLSYTLEHGRPAVPVLEPVLSWKARISQVKRVPAGSFVGYGCSFQTTRETLLAVLPVGYSDGYDRRLSNQAHVLVRGRRAPVRGRICMNLMMIDVTDVAGVELEDEVRSARAPG